MTPAGVAPVQIAKSRAITRISKGSLPCPPPLKSAARAALLPCHYQTAAKSSALMPTNATFIRQYSSAAFR
jgi:hypothetical protein